MEDCDQIHAWLFGREAERAVVVGAGYVGLEMVENLCRLGMDVARGKDGPGHGPMDPEMLGPLYARLAQEDVDLRLNCGVARIEQGREEMLHVVAQDSSVFPADVVILAAGVRPEVDLARAAGLEIGELGGIRVDDQMRTSDPNILAVGDAVEVRDWVTGRWTLVPWRGRRAGKAGLPPT